MKAYTPTLFACICTGILLLSSEIYGIERNLIQDIEISGHTIRYRVNRRLHYKYLLEDLYVTYQDDINLNSLDYTILTMPLLLNIYSIILISGERYYIEAMDKDLYQSLKIVTEALKRLFPSTRWDGQLVPRKLINNNKAITQKTEHTKFGMPFSHGLDSICTSLRHKDTPQLLLTVRGCPDTPLDMWHANWKFTQNTIMKFADQYGHECSFVYSNFHEFFNWDVLGSMSPEILNWRMDTIEDLGWIGIAAPILVTKEIHTFVLAANKDWNTPHPGISSPITNDTMSIAGITVQTDAFELSRTEKNFVVARICNEHKLQKPTTFVCEHNYENRQNCCECTKCVFTILSWILAQENPRDYGFDVEIVPFLHHFKNKFFYENLYSPYRAGCFKYMQLKARQELERLNGQLHDFFSWFLTINFDKLTLPTPQIVVNYDDFKDLYPQLPADWKKYRDELVLTHIPDRMPESMYTKIWQKTAQ